MKSNESLFKNRIKIEIEQQLLKCKHESDIHENEKPQNE